MKKGREVEEKGEVITSCGWSPCERETVIRTPRLLEAPNESVRRISTHSAWQLVSGLQMLVVLDVRVYFIPKITQEGETNTEAFIMSGIDCTGPLVFHMERSVPKQKEPKEKEEGNTNPSWLRVGLVLPPTPVALDP